jgi:hypothetical protein
MPFDPHKLCNRTFRDIEHAYSEKDTMLYAPGLGCGSDPGDHGDLKFVYERGLVALPTMAVVLAPYGNWLESEDSTVDYRKVLHGEQYLTLHQPLAPSATVIGRGRIVDLLDEGKEKGAVLYAERTLIDKASGEPIATMTSAAMLRGDGGFGGRPGPAATAPASRAADASPRHQDPRQFGADLPPLRRPQSPARRPGRGGGRAVSRRRSCTACAPSAWRGAPSSRSAAAATPCVLRACRWDSQRLSNRARRSARRCGPTAARSASAPASWNATWSC